MNDIVAAVIGVFSALLPLGSIIAVLIIKYSKSEKARQDATKVNFWIEQATKYVKEAEKLIDTNGKEKKEFVEANINKACLRNKINYEPEKISNIIEDIVKTTKLVNNPETKVVKEEVKTEGQ